MAASVGGATLDCPKRASEPRVASTTVFRIGDSVPDAPRRVLGLAVETAAGHGGDDIGEIGLLFRVGACDEVALGGEAAIDAAGDAGGDGAADVGSAGE